MIMDEMRDYFSKERDVDFSLTLSVAKEFGLDDSLVIDLSSINYTPGIVGITQSDKTDDYVVYEIDEHKLCNVLLNTSSEKEACLEALGSLGVKFK